MKLEQFEDVIRVIRDNRREFHILLGNGFSMAYDTEIFSYNALYDFISQIDDKVVSKLYGIVRTTNFEQIMHQLDICSRLLEAFDADKAMQEKIARASAALKGNLIRAVRELHPEHVFTIPQKSIDSCARFLKLFNDTKGQIYTTNYDLLLYWTLMRSKVMTSCDGFGREKENPDANVPDKEVEYSELRWGKHKDDQNVFYLHGALPFFDTGVEIVKEEYDNQKYLLENISRRMDHGEYPIFVTAGNGQEKLTHIMHNHYLSYAYEKLLSITGSLVTYGFRFSEYDDHIISAINTAAKHGNKAPSKLWSIYIGVFSSEDCEYIEHLAGRFKCKVHMYDARTVDIWGRT